jgi:hypothetical protein
LLAKDRAERRTKPENANEIPCSNLVLGRLVGSGAFAEVRVGKWKGQDVATRRLHGAWSPQESNDFKAEAAIQQQLRHLNVVALFGTSTRVPEWLMIVLELSTEVRPPLTTLRFLPWPHGRRGLPLLARQCSPALFIPPG